MAKPMFRGVCASTVTPFKNDGSLDLARIKPHVDWIIADGANGISPLGSSGEFAALDSAERRAVLEATIDANAGRVPVVAGTHHCRTSEAVALSRHAEQAGADALLIVPPFYMAPTPSQVMNHYRRIAEAVSIPIVLYHNIPLTAVDLRTEHIVRLFEETAAAEGIALQRSAQVGVLTDLSYVQTVGQGVASIDVGFPMRHSHSATECCDLADLAELARLCVAALARIGLDMRLDRGA